MSIPQVDITGKKYGLLTAVRWVKTEKYITKRGGKEVYHNFWEFECECGRKKILRKSRVTSGKSAIRSCGCTRNKYKWKGYEQISGTYWGVLKKSAKKRKLKFSITMKEAWAKYLEQNGICALSGVAIGFGPNQMASIDRIDSTQGYVVGNIQWVHRVVNCMKWDMTEAELLQWCRRVVEYLEKGD